MSQDTVIDPHRRLAILRLLAEENGALNESVIRSGLEAQSYQRVTPESVRADLRWLEQAGAIATEWFTGGFSQLMGAKLTSRGLNVAEGKEVVEGIHKPRVA